jgi:hypothetical protein
VEHYFQLGQAGAGRGIDTEALSRHGGKRFGHELRDDWIAATVIVPDGR